MLSYENFVPVISYENADVKRHVHYEKTLMAYPIKNAKALIRQQLFALVSQTHMFRDTRFLS